MKQRTMAARTKKNKVAIESTREVSRTPMRSEPLWATSCRGNTANPAHDSVTNDLAMSVPALSTVDRVRTHGIDDDMSDDGKIAMSAPALSTVDRVRAHGNVQRRRATGDDERRMQLRCLVEDRVAFPPFHTNADTRAPLRGASTTTRARQSKEEERVIDRSLEIEHLLWIDEPEYQYDAEKDVHSFKPGWLRRYKSEKDRLLGHLLTPPPRSLKPNEYDPNR